MTKTKFNFTTGEAITSLITDLKIGSKTMSRSSARFLVQTYYQIQRERIIQGNRQSALDKTGDSSNHLVFMQDMFGNLEDTIKTWLDVFSDSHPAGHWAREQHGVGPVLAAGLLAYLDMEKCPNISSFWSFAGYNPTMVWEKGQKRPFAAPLKTICWKLGESFVKVSGNPEAKYGQIYVQRKAYEWAKNARGEYASLIGKRNYKYGVYTESYKWASGQYSGVTKTAAGYIPNTVGPCIPMIPPQAIQERAKRYAVKRFLSDFWVISYRHHFGTDAPAPMPWINTHGGHPDYIEPVT